MTAIKSFLKSHKASLLYGIGLALLLLILKWLEIRFLIFDHALELYIGLIAIIFTALGIWLALKLSKPKIKTIIIEKEVYLSNNDPGRDQDFVPDELLIKKLELSKRELEILSLMAEGNSNQEIAHRIFVSLSTVKTHNQNLFEKLEVKRRTQAIEKGKRLKLIP